MADAAKARSVVVVVVVSGGGGFIRRVRENVKCGRGAPVDNGRWPWRAGNGGSERVPNNYPALHVLIIVISIYYYREITRTAVIYDFIPISYARDVEQRTEKVKRRA